MGTHSLEPLSFVDNILVFFFAIFDDYWFVQNLYRNWLQLCRLVCFQVRYNYLTILLGFEGAIFNVEQVEEHCLELVSHFIFMHVERSTRSVSIFHGHASLEESLVVHSF